MNYLERYLNGEHEPVWSELHALGPAVREEPHSTPAGEVAAETMRRVRRNCETLVARLRAQGYIFGTYPDGTRRSYAVEPLTPPDQAMLTDLRELEAQAGPLPLSLIAFYQQVGAVDLVGMHPAWPDGLDPLVVDPPEGALSWLEVDEMEQDEECFAALAPDDLHKDNVSGGDPYGLLLPNAGADFEFVNERHGLLFVPYLRLAILQWGGLPGLGVWGEKLEAHAELVAGLEPF